MNTLSFRPSMLDLTSGEYEVHLAKCYDLDFLCYMFYCDLMIEINGVRFNGKQLDGIGILGFLQSLSEGVRILFFEQNSVAVDLYLESKDNLIVDSIGNEFVIKTNYSNECARIVQADFVNMLFDFANNVFKYCEKLQPVLLEKKVYLDIKSLILKDMDAIKNHKWGT